MNQQAIAALSTSGVAVEVVSQTGSTNADLLARAPCLSGPVLLVAENQTAGRGRAGRSWLSAPGSSLTFSLAWKFSGVGKMTGLPLAVGVALAETLARLGVQVRLKWPNDMLKDGDKLAGILIETAPSYDGGTWAVIGVGMNLVMPDELERQIGRAVSSVPWLARMDRDELVAALLDGLAAALGAFERTGFAGFAPRWNRLHGWQGETVVILDHGQVLHEGVAAGVDDSGRLLLDCAQGRIAVAAGDVSLRIKEA